VIVSQIKLLLNYSNRFYKRQFIERKAVAHGQLGKIEKLLDQYFDGDRTLKQGLPTVQYLADHMHLSPGFLSDTLRTLTGRNAQQLIHQKLIEKVKGILSTSHLFVAEIAYQLGFKHPQSFTRLFKSKTQLSLWISGCPSIDPRQNFANSKQSINVDLEADSARISPHCALL
jgi:AraC family transcriptional activator of pobA